MKPVNIQCEVPILSVNESGQTVSGSIDMLIETEEGFWIIDHKTDKQVDFKKHTEQLVAYSSALKLDKKLLGFVINWTSTESVEIYSGKHVYN